MAMLQTLVLISLVTPPGPAPDALKCQSHSLPGVVTVVDDVVVRDTRIDGDSREAARKVMPADDDILNIEIRCYDVHSGEAGVPPTRRSAIIILTKPGAPALFETQLAALVEEQRLYRERTGRYAATLTELNFFAGRSTLPIELTVSGDGWSASVGMKEVPASCRVAVGSAASLDSALRAGIPQCGPPDA